MIKKFRSDDVKMQIIKNVQIIITYPLTKESEALISDFLSKLSESELMQKKSNSKGLNGIIRIPKY